MAVVNFSDRNIVSRSCLVLQCQALEKALWRLKFGKHCVLGMNVGMPATYALAESVLACVLTAVTRLSCATNFEAYSARSSHNSSA
jgi:hypothetical protein